MLKLLKTIVDIWFEGISDKGEAMAYFGTSSRMTTPLLHRYEGEHS